jgi:hypothetical protein
MADNPTIIDFLSESLRSARSGQERMLSPNQQRLSDELATLMDEKLSEMVRELEAVASCRQEEIDVPEQDKKPPFEGFCNGLHKIGDTLLPYLVQTFAQWVQTQNLEKTTFQWILDARSDAFINYLMELARVHGVAFDETLISIGQRERLVLQQLETDLRSLYQSTFDLIPV